MEKRKRYIPHRAKRGGTYKGNRGGTKKKPLEIRPAADAKLKKVFATIGVPEKKEFKPDPFQLKALDAIEHTDCIVTAPTGSGKTWIAEKAIERLRSQGKKSWYASPLKALTNSKYKEFSDIFGAENLGILTGDRKENPEAPIIVGTTEILRNQLYDAMHQGETLSTDFVILDEAHYLGDEDRGVVWEEIMIYLPSRIPLLLLSATVGNAGQIAAWLSSIRGKKCVVVAENRRSVPLFPLFFHPSGRLLPLLSTVPPQKKQENKKNQPRKKPGIYKKVSEYVGSKNPPVFASVRNLPPMGEIMGVLKKYHLTPAIFFLKSRADCDNSLELCRGNPVPQTHQKQIAERIQELAAQVPYLAKHRHTWHLEHLAVASHHSGHLPAWKLFIETLMTEGLLDAVFATSTVAAGVNFPARTVVFLNSDKFNGLEFIPLTSTEFHQMTGRAGRRGMDQIGFAVAIPGKFMDTRLFARLINAPPSYVLSQIRINFSMTLNLLLSHTPNQIEELLEKSFATYLLTKCGKKKKARSFIDADYKYLWRDFLQHFNFLIETGYVSEDGMLTEDGVWTSQLRVDQPLMIAEGFRNQVFPESDPVLLAAVMASFVNDQETDDRIDKDLISKELLDTFLRIRKGLRPFVKMMVVRGFEPRSLYLRPAVSIYEWASGKSWEDTLLVAEMAEGNLAMLIFRTADNLRHIRNLAEVFPQAAETAANAIDLILREPVVTFYE